MKITKDWILSKDACSDGAEWGIKTVGSGVELPELVKLFERADWLIWTLGKAEVLTHQQVVLLACLCARRAQRFWKPKSDKRPMDAIRAAARWARNPTEENRDAAWDAGDAAGDAGDAGDAAGAAWAAARAAGAAARAAWAAAGAAAWDAGDAEHKAMCAAIRKRLKAWRVFEKPAQEGAP